MSEFADLPRDTPPGEEKPPEAVLDDFRAKAGALSQMISSPGWSETRVILRGRLDMLFASLLDPSRARERAASDDYLRGQIAALSLLLKTPLDLLSHYAKIVREAEAEMIAQRAAGEPDPWATRAAEYGIRMAGFPDSHDEGQPL